MHWQPLTLALGAALSATLALFGWDQRRRAPGASSFALFMMSVAFWSAMYGIELGESDLGTKLLWSHLKYLGIVVAPAAFLAFAFQYTGHGGWLSPRTLGLLSIEPVVVVLLAFTEHESFQTGFALEAGGSATFLLSVFGPAFWAHVAYSYLLILAGMLLIGRALLARPGPFTAQASAILAGAFTPLLANVLYLSGASPFGRLDLTPFALILTGLATAWAVFRHGLLDLVPVARESLIESLGDGVIVLDSLGRVVDLNPAAARIFGRPAADAVGQSIERLMPSVSLLLGPGEAPRELSLGEGGDLRHLELAVVLLPGERGSPPGRLVTLRDLTERRWAEEALRRTEAEQRHLLESVKAIVWRSDYASLAFSYVSHEAEALLGYPVERWTSEPTFWVDHMHPDDREWTVSFCRTASEGMLPYEFEYRMVAADGRVVWLRDIVRVVVRDARPTAMVGFMVDITASKQAEATLTASLERFEALATLAPVGIFTTDSEGDCTFVNERWCAIAGLTPEEAMGPGWVRALHPEDRARVSGEWYAAAQEGREFASEYRFRTPEGRVSWVSGAAVALKGAGGKVEGHLGTVTDLTERRSTEEALRRGETMSAMGSLVAALAHEVRNPLFAISSTLDAFEARFGVREEHGKYVAVLREQMERLSELMRDLLEYGKPAPLDLAPGQVEDVVAQALVVCAARARRSKVKVVNKVRRGLPPVLFERRRLVQAFQNLIDNAIQHSAPESVVDVEAAETLEGDGLWIEFMVRDSGPGIRVEDLSRIFEPFFTRRRGGTGLGLSIVLRIVEEHGGTISAENGHAGGAVLTIRLPALRSKEASTAEDLASS